MQFQDELLLQPLERTCIALGAHFQSFSSVTGTALGWKQAGSKEGGSLDNLGEEANFTSVHRAQAVPSLTLA